MELVGRKQYHAWSDELTVGLGVITRRWSGFVENPKDTAIVQLFDLRDFMGEIIDRPIGAPSQVLFGRDVNALVSNNAIWTPAAEWTAPAGFIGRRVLTTWADDKMLVIDKVVGPPARFGVEPRPYASAMLFDIFETLDGLLEKKVGLSESNVFGKSANELVEYGYPWLSVGDEKLAQATENLDDEASVDGPKL